VKLFLFDIRWAYCTSSGWEISMTQSVEWKQAGETEILGENLLQWRRLIAWATPWQLMLAYRKTSVIPAGILTEIRTTYLQNSCHLDPTLSVHSVSILEWRTESSGHIYGSECLGLLAIISASNPGVGSDYSVFICFHNIAKKTSGNFTLKHITIIFFHINELLLDLRFYE
jgi:hypothetical protein